MRGHGVGHSGLLHGWHHGAWWMHSSQRDHTQMTGRAGPVPHACPRVQLHAGVRIGSCCAST
eukprot:14263393-Alexandrium_andersonii.AAC.1